MPKYKVELARLVRETRVVVVEATSEQELDDKLGEVYDADDDLGLWEEDAEWGCEEGTHQVIGPCPDDQLHLYHEVKLGDE